MISFIISVFFPLEWYPQIFLIFQSIFFIIYLIILGPLALRGMEISLKKQIIPVGISSGISLAFSFFSIEIAEIFNHFITLTIYFFLLLTNIILHIRMIKALKKVDSKKFDDYVNYVMQADSEIFKTPKLKILKNTRFILHMLIILLLASTNRNILVILIFFQIITNIILHKKFSDTLNKSLVKKFNKYCFIEALLFALGFTSIIFGNYSIAFLLILLSNLKFEFIKEDILYLRYLEFLKDE